MVTRKWLRSALTALLLYTVAGAVIAYFGLNAYSGNRGLRAKQDLEEQIAQLNDELAGLRAERARWERRVLLLRPGSIDPDMLDERARTLLNYADPRDLTLRLTQSLPNLRPREFPARVACWAPTMMWGSARRANSP
jgi:cell division protein FtsB